MGHRTIPQFCEDEGISRYMADHLINTGQLAYLPIGKRKHVPDGAWEDYVKRSTIQPCQDEAQDQNSSGSKSANAFTSSGPRTAAESSAQRARKINETLKHNSQTSCTKGKNHPGLVIQGTF